MKGWLSGMNESRAAGARVVWSMMAAAAGFALLVMTFGEYYSIEATTAILFVFGMLTGGGLAAVVINVVVFVRAGDTGRVKVVKVNSYAHPTGGRLVNRASKNTLEIGRSDLSSNEWRRLAVVLSGANWKWTRRLLAETHIWEALTKGRRYALVCEEFERMEVVDVRWKENGDVEGVTMTSEGIEKICQWAGTPLL